MLLLAETAFRRTLNLIRIIPAEGVSKSVFGFVFIVAAANSLAAAIFIFKE